MLRGIALLAAVTLAATAPALAEIADAGKIRASIIGNTVQGDMNGPYTEYYTEDGVVHGKDYKAQWSIEGDTMCWVYVGSPKDCWQIDIAGDQVQFIKDGKAAGSGTILKGNPNNL